MISVSPRARRGTSCPDRRPVTQSAHHRATPVCHRSARPRLLLLSHAPVASRPSRPRHRLTRLISRPASKSHFLPQHPVHAGTPSGPVPEAGPPSSAPPARVPPTPFTAVTPAPSPSARRHARTGPRKPNATPKIRGKPFLAAGNGPADYSESPTPRARWERIEGVSRSLPFSDLLALTSSHMFFSVMN